MIVESGVWRGRTLQSVPRDDRQRGRLLPAERPNYSREQFQGELGFPRAPAPGICSPTPLSFSTTCSKVLAMPAAARPFGLSGSKAKPRTAASSIQMRLIASAKSSSAHEACSVAFCSMCEPHDQCADAAKANQGSDGKGHRPRITLPTTRVLQRLPPPTDKPTA